MPMTTRTLRTRQASSVVFGASLMLPCLSLVLVWALTGEASALRMGLAGAVLFGALAAYRVQYLRRAYLRQEADTVPDRPHERARVERRTWLAVTAVIVLALVPSLLTWPMGGHPAPTLNALPAMVGLVAALVLRWRAIRAELDAAQATTDEPVEST